MNISKISRGLVVCIFIIFVITLAGLNIFSTIQNGIVIGSVFLKFLYIFSLIIVTVIYSVIKEKLSNKNIAKRKNIFVRYVVISIISLLVKFFIGIFIDPKQNILDAGVFAVFALLNAGLLKKIIYNISKSDVLSVIGMIMYVFLPNMSAEFVINIRSYINVCILLLIIMLMQKIIDEIKQIGIKNLKYVYFSICLGICISISMVLGINSIVWIILAVVSLTCTSNLDKTHINFPNKFINMLRQKSKELLYRFERIYINKVVIVIAVLIIVVISVYFGISYLIYNVIKCEDLILFISEIKVTNNVLDSIKIVKNANYIDILSNLMKLVDNSKIYTFLLILYIVFIEFLNVALRRKYDTKSTIIKAMFVAIMLAYAILDLNYIGYTQLLQVFLILIAIINTTNLYLNRDERIKLLNA